MSSRDPARRAHRLIAIYPTAWRERYGSEFQAHLEQEFEERPFSLTRTFNIVTKGLIARVKVATWRFIFMQPEQERFDGFVLLPIAVIVGVAIAGFAGWPLHRRTPWPAQVIVGILFAFVIAGLIHDTHRARTSSPSRRSSKERLVPLVFILANTLPILLRTHIGHGMLLLYSILTFDILLFVFRFGWLRPKRGLTTKATGHRLHGKSNL